MVFDPPETYDVGSPLLASGFDDLLRAADERLSRLYSGSRSWFAFDTSSVPSQQVPISGAVYVLSPDGDRDILPAPGTPGCPHGGLWPAMYDHAAHVAAVNALVIFGPSADGAAWQVTSGYVADVYSAGDALSVMERNVAGDTRPVRYPGAIEPERFHRYALADVFIESAADSTFEFPFDKFGVVRFHNLSRISVNVDLGSASISIEPRRVRTVRRTGRTAAWTVSPVRRYFPVALPGDVPIWDSYPGNMENLPLRSMAANPLFREALLVYMFRPQALTSGPGLFSATILGSLPPVDPAGAIASAIVMPGTIEAIRHDTVSLEVSRHTISYSAGESFAVTPPSWAAIGLTVSLDTPSRGAIVSTDPSLPTTHFSLISRGTNVSGGIVVSAYPSRTLLPWFADAAAADAWYLSLFDWPELGVSRTSYEFSRTEGSTWTPTGGSLDPDYYGSWTGGTLVTYREYVLEWTGSSPGTVSPWNVFTKRIVDALPDGGSLVRSSLFTAVVAYPSAEFHYDREDATYDDAGTVVPRASAGDRGLLVGSEYWGLGEILDGALVEPRFKVALFPTIGQSPSTSWLAMPFHSSEELVYTPAIPDGAGGTVSHFRLGGTAAGGAPWTWDYVGTYSPVAYEPSAPVGSGMTFWRVFDHSTPLPGSGVPYPGRSKTGPMPYLLRDHGWLADETLNGGAAALGGSWISNLPILVDSAGRSSVEERTAMQLRVPASAKNLISSLLRGISHVRPCGWEQYVDGFSFSGLVLATNGWYLGLNDVYVAPQGAIHIYGRSPSMDIALDNLGIVRRSAASSELQALQSTDAYRYVKVSYPVPPPPPIMVPGPVQYYETEAVAPLWPSDVGDTLQFITADDLHNALEVEGFAFNLATLVQPVSIEILSPGEEIEEESDVYESDEINMVVGRLRFERTAAIPYPDSSNVSLQRVPNEGRFYDIAPERPMRASLIIRDAGGAFRSVRRVGPTSGSVADAVERMYSPLEFFLGDPSEFDGQSVMWSARVLARSGLTVRVLAIPLRRVLPVGRELDDSGPYATEGFATGLDHGERRISLALPDDSARAQYLSLSPGDDISLASLAGSENPAYPEKHHIWRLLPLDGSIEEI